MDSLFRPLPLSFLPFNIFGQRPCTQCSASRIPALTPPLNGSTTILASWTFDELRTSNERSCKLCQFILSILILGEDSDAQKSTGPDLSSNHSSEIYLTSDANISENLFQPRLSWIHTKSGKHLRSLPIHPSSATIKVPASLIATYGRRVMPQIDLHWLRIWLRDSCGLPSANMCQPLVPGNISRTVRLRLVDTKLRQVIYAYPVMPTFVCLSYVWGPAAIPKLMTENYSQYTKKWGIRKADTKGAQVIEDAILLILRLGFRYLWVDALCIIQDDAHDLSIYLPLMGRIYGGAALTIACDSTDASTGIPGISAGRPHSSPILNAYGFNLVSSRATLSAELESSVWFKRGWTLQEMCFSRRILLFTKSQVFFWVDNKLYMEDGSRDTTSRFESDRLSDTINTNSLTLVTLKSFSDALQTNDDSLTVASTNYQQLVRVYVNRRLTHEGDIIRAFEGVLKYFESELGEHVWGIPTHMFPNALLWRIDRPGRRRKSFPSWSWSGWLPYPNSQLAHLKRCSMTAKIGYYPSVNELALWITAKFWKLTLANTTDNISEVIKGIHLDSVRKHAMDSSLDAESLVVLELAGGEESVTIVMVIGEKKKARRHIRTWERIQIFEVDMGAWKSLPASCERQFVVE